MRAPAPRPGTMRLPAALNDQQKTFPSTAMVSQHAKKRIDNIRSAEELGPRPIYHAPKHVEYRHNKQCNVRSKHQQPTKSLCQLQSQLSPRPMEHAHPTRAANRHDKACITRETNRPSTEGAQNSPHRCHNNCNVQHSKHMQGHRTWAQFRYDTHCS